MAESILKAAGWCNRKAVQEGWRLVEGVHAAPHVLRMGVVGTYFPYAIERLPPGEVGTVLEICRGVTFSGWMHQEVALLWMLRKIYARAQLRSEYHLTACVLLRLHAPPLYALARYTYESARVHRRITLTV